MKPRGRFVCHAKQDGKQNVPLPGVVARTSGQATSTLIATLIGVENNTLV
ncbi:MAG TPA: hypothetical protein VN456_01150 [Desulfosporosinus sp.]|nr:hypothetical protein [Desulfosporosinus sp.]